MMNQGSWVGWLLFLLYCYCCNSLSIGPNKNRPSTTANNKPSSSSSVDWVAAVREAAKASNNDDAYKACDLWDKIPLEALEHDAVRVVATAMKATTLTQVGRDAEACQVFNTILLFNNASSLLNDDTLQDVIIGRAGALQRLMRYQEAQDQYLEASDDRATWGAVTCCMRMRDLDGAIQILMERDCDGVVLKGLLAVLQMTMKGKSGKGLQQQIKAGALESPLLTWIHRHASLYNDDDDDAPVSRSIIHDFDLIQVAAINQSPLDDPALIVLDDKVKLHNLLAHDEECRSFWPRGYILPDQLNKLKQEEGDHDCLAWILKSRSGYGSHGNQVVSVRQVLTTSPKQKNQMLLQELVSPPLLLQGRKFSLRIYVILFGTEHHVLAEQGLVKIASDMLDDSNNEGRMHMTNSGRAQGMEQQTLVMLKKELGLDSFQLLWTRIGHAVDTIMLKYREYNTADANDDVYRTRLMASTLGSIPKILGLDFMLTKDLHPMLLEVNRFPGLEPRDEQDTSVKTAVIRQAFAGRSEIGGKRGEIT